LRLDSDIDVVAQDGELVSKLQEIAFL
jgi:hypothetical protein